MMTVTCKSFRVCHEAENVVLEIENAAPANLVPQLLTKDDVAKRLAISVRKIQDIVASGRLPIVRLDGCVRFREEDVLRFVEESRERNPKPILRVLPDIKRSQERKPKPMLKVPPAIKLTV